MNKTLTSQALYEKDSSLGVLICGHGSRSAKAVREFKALAQAIKSKLDGVSVEYAYLEFARPIIREALESLSAQSVDKVLAIPAMLFAAGHAKNDIPSVLNTYSSETGLQILYGRELGVDRLMISAAGERIKEVINSSSDFPLSETLLVVVGRGSSDPDANSNVTKITRMLVEGFGFGWGETVYSGVTFPLVEPGLRHCVKLGFKRIIVFPYFLFSGVLIDRINSHIERVAQDYTNIEFLNAKYLGDHPFVVDTFLNRISETIHGDNSMNCSLCKYRDSILGFESEVGLAQASHHHHVEGIDGKHQSPENNLTTLPFSEEINNKREEMNDLHVHSHFHYLYPHADHPLGPSSLSNKNISKSKEN